MITLNNEFDFEDNWDFVEQFESRLARYTGFKYAITTDCCTNAIMLSFEYIKRTKDIQQKDYFLMVPRWTYASVPMTLVNHGWKVKLSDIHWVSHYSILLVNDVNVSNTMYFPSVIDCAVDFKKNLYDDIKDDECFCCISFQQKKRLPLGRGGAILTNNKEAVDMLRRLRYDGRNPRIPDRIEFGDGFHDDIPVGYHCYMEPDKASRGILMMNQNELRPYEVLGSSDYPDLSLIQGILTQESYKHS